MRQCVHYLLLFFIFSLLSACGARYEMVHSFVPPVSANGKQCVQHCQHARHMCNALHEQGHKACFMKAKREAMVKFTEYKRHQQALNHPVSREQADFYHPQACQKKNLECEHEYASCYQICGGEVQTQRVCVENCKNA